MPNLASSLCFFAATRCEPAPVPRQEDSRGKRHANRKEGPERESTAARAWRKGGGRGGDGGRGSRSQRRPRLDTRTRPGSALSETDSDDHPTPGWMDPGRTPQPHPRPPSPEPQQKLAKITVIGERFALRILAGELDTRAIIKEIQNMATEMFDQPLTRSREIAEIPEQLPNTLNLNN